MNAPNSVSQDPRQDLGVAERKAYEPSMEEILASIRRIIADDQAVVSRRPPVPQEPEEPLSDTTHAEGMTPPELPGEARPGGAEALAPQGKTTPPEGAPQHAKRGETAPEPPPARDVPKKPAPLEQSAIAGLENLAKMHDLGRFVPKADRAPIEAAVIPKRESALVSPATGAAVSSSFNALAASRFLNDNMNDMVREMLRPMLQSWLDDNLPILVERLVRAEIERVARGR